MKQPKTISVYHPMPSTTELFSWRFLARHPRTQPIVEKYFGKLGIELYAHEQYSRRRCFAVEGTSADFRAEINAIPASELCDADIFSTDISGQTEEAIRKYLYGQPYFLMLSEDEFSLAVAIIFLLRKNLQQISPDTESLSFFSSPTLWQDAMIYIRYQNQRIFNLGDETLERGRDAVLAYQASYLIDKLGLERTCALVQNFFNIDRFIENKGKFYEFINEVLGEDLSKKFLVQTKPKIIDLDSLDFEKIFRYPEWIEFTPATNDEIIRRILHDELAEREIDYYLGVSETHENYVKLFPAIKHVIQKTNNAHLLWTAGDVLNLIWKNLPEDPELQKWMRHQIYEMYWPRIESVWPIEHYNEIEFKDENYHRIFDDALNWIMCLNDITKQSNKIKAYLARLVHNDFKDIQATTPAPVWKRAFNVKFQRLDTKHTFKAAWENLDTYEVWRYLSFPETIKEADLTLDKAINDLTVPREEAGFGLEQLLMHGAPIKVGAYSITYLVESFDQLGLKFGDNPEEMVVFFTAACTGASEEDEAKPLEKLAAKYHKAYDGDPKCKDLMKRVDVALKLAKQTIANFKREEADLGAHLVEHTEAVAAELKERKAAAKAKAATKKQEQ